MGVRWGAVRSALLLHTFTISASRLESNARSGLLGVFSSSYGIPHSPLTAMRRGTPSKPPPSNLPIVTRARCHYRPVHVMSGFSTLTHPASGYDWAADFQVGLSIELGSCSPQLGLTAPLHECYR
ncbi:hypothetical protein C8Q76DRAFT_133371 [Earliella scabrosa]|nr:hypothetical protein C8Q76DRAFT_133371 [Earliella scabrosa]